MNPQRPISTQEDFFDSIASDALKIWCSSIEGILMLPESQRPSGNALVTMHQEIKRLMRKFIQMTPSQLGEAIRVAHRKQLHSDFPRVTILEIENELHQIGMNGRNERALPAHTNWAGNPSECLDRNWGEIWIMSVRKSIEVGERVRAFDWEYLDPFDDSDKAQVQVRNMAFAELKRRVGTHPSFDGDRLRLLIREEMHRHLIAAFPKYRGDIEREVWTMDFFSLNELSANICGRDQSRDAMKFVKRPSIENCERLVAFDLYAEMQGCKWPEFAGRPAPKVEKPPIKPSLGNIPKSLDEMEV